MAYRKGISHGDVMEMVLSLIEVGEEFDVVHLRWLAANTHDANVVNRAVLQMSRYKDPVFEHLSRGRYRLIRKHYVNENEFKATIPDKGVCPECHITIPANGVCGNC